MTFFDKKEEVMKIELTPYGRYLLSIGKLKPHSYRFFDENIIYDSNCGGVVEAQNDAHIRIVDETPILKGNPNITGVETNIKKFDSDDVNIRNVRQPTTDDVISSNNESIGTNDYSSTKSPYFRVDLFRGNMLEDKISNTYITGSVVGSPIPQLPIKIHLSASYVDANTAPFLGDNNTISFETNEFEDGKRIRVQYQEPIVRIVENNGFDETDNFRITAYKVFIRDLSNKEIVYQRMKFPKRKKKIVNGILLDNVGQVDNFFEGFETADQLNDGINLEDEIDDTKRIDHYLDLTTDKLISEIEICSAIGNLKIKNIFLDEEIQCPDPEVSEQLNIYSSRVGPDDLEDCD